MIPLWLGIGALLVAELIAVLLTLRDPGLSSTFDRVVAASLWPIFAGIGVWRGTVAGLPIEVVMLLGAAAVFAACVFTGGMPALLFFSSVRRKGKLVRGLVVRRVLGWAGLIASAVAISGLALDFGLVVP